MTKPSQDFAHRSAVEIYGAFIDRCVLKNVANDRIGNKSRKNTKDQIDGRPVRLVTISGKGGWSSDPILLEKWKQNYNISLLDHLLSVVRGALMFWLLDQPRSWSSQTDLEEIKRLAYALVCIAFLHDIDKDLNLRRGEKISEENVAERMHRYGINEFLSEYYKLISPAAMLNYIEEVEGTQAARSPTASDFDKRVAHTCKYVELADKLEGIFTSLKSNSGVSGVIASLSDPNHWPILQDEKLRNWKKIEIHDHLHIFLLDRFQQALSTTCTEVSGCLPLIDIAHDGQLLCVVPKIHADEISNRAVDRFLEQLPYKLRFATNNKLACEFTGGEISWAACCKTMRHTTDWSEFSNLLSLSKEFATDDWKLEINELFEMAGMASSWPVKDSDGATVKPAIQYPGGEPYGLSMEPAHALVFLVIVLNHKDAKQKNRVPDSNMRGQQLLELLTDEGKTPPINLDDIPRKFDRERHIIMALWAIAEVWQLASSNLGSAQNLLDRITGQDGLVGHWLDGNEYHPGITEQVKDEASDIKKALHQRFLSYLRLETTLPFDSNLAHKHCILCNEPVAANRKVSSTSRTHGIKASAFSGRDQRNDHLASPSSDTHICLICLAESQLRQTAQEQYKGSKELPPLISSPTTTGLFGGLAFQRENTEKSMGLNELNRLDIKKGSVYEGLDCHIRRIRLARLEELPKNDKKLVALLRMLLKAIQRTGRPIHIFRGSPQRHPGIFFFDSLPTWLEQFLGDNSLRIEQLEEALSNLEFFELLSNKPGLGIEWAKQLADANQKVRIGALCVAWALALDRMGSGDADHAWNQIKFKTRRKVLSIFRKSGGDDMNIKDNSDPLIRLAWLATRIQKRVKLSDSANKQLLCWNTALDFYRFLISDDRSALVLGTAGTLEETLSRKNDAAAKKYRDNETLGKACIKFAEHFADNVWTKVFNSKEPTSQERRRAAAIYRFALIEAYNERDVAESDSNEIASNASTK